MLLLLGENYAKIRKNIVTFVKKIQVDTSRATDDHKKWKRHKVNFSRYFFETDFHLSSSLSLPLSLFLSLIWGKRGYQKLSACLGNGEKVDRSDTNFCFVTVTKNLPSNKRKVAIENVESFVWWKVAFRQ